MENNSASHNSIQTNQIVFTSYMTRRSVTTVQSDMSDDVIQRFILPLRKILDTNEKATIQELGYWFSAKMKTDTLVSTIGMREVEVDVLAMLTVEPPLADGEPAQLMFDLSGFINAVKLGIFQDQHDINNIPVELSDLARCIAWSWLVMTGHVKLGNT